MAEDGKKFVLYHYDPSLATAAIFTVLFLITTLLHGFQVVRHKTWYFIPFVIGGIFEVGGYIGRAMSAKQSPNWTIGPYIQQSLLLLLAPALFAASIYMILGRIIRMIDGEQHSMIRTKWLTKVFVAGDVLSFLAQSGGGGMLAKAKTPSDVKTGEHVITGGLIIQILFFGFFMIVSSVFHYRMSIVPTSRSQLTHIPWARYMWILYTASVLIMVRSVFRVAEYVQGQDGFLLKTEAYLYAFDAALMWVMMVLFNVYHPHKIVAGKRDLERNGEGYLMTHS